MKNIGSNKMMTGSTPTAKRLQVLQYIITALQKLAATRNCAVVLLSQCATRMQSERGAALVPAVNATVWELGVSTRLVLYKDWVWHGSQLRSVSIVRVQKLDGKTLDDSTNHVAAFMVTKVCAKRPHKHLGTTDTQLSSRRVSLVYSMRLKTYPLLREEPRQRGS